MRLSLKMTWMILMLCLLAMGCDKAKPPEKTPTPAPPVVVEAPEVVKEQPASAQQAPLLWEVTSKEGGKKVHLLGTIHIGFDAQKELPQEVWARLDASQLFVMETDLNAAQASMLASAALPEGESLEDKLGPEHWKKLDELLGGSASQFRGVKPWFMVSMLMLKMLPEGERSAPMDQVLHDYAQSKGKEVDYLESPGLQLGVLEKALTVEELKEMLSEFEQQRKDLSAMMEFYRLGDVDGIKSVSFKDSEEKTEMYEILFYKRNEAWIVKIEEYLKRGDVFVAFGAGHLFGERGVLELLEQQGHTVKRMTLDEPDQGAANDDAEQDVEPAAAE